MHVCRSGWPAIGGLESAVHGLSSALVRRGHRSTVITLDRSPSGQRLHEAIHEGVRYVRRSRRGPARYPFARGLPNTLRDADLVHVHGIDGLADQVALARGHVPAGLSTHGGYFHTPWAMSLKRCWWQSVSRRTLRHLDAVWFTSQADADRFGDLRGQVVPNGIDARRFRPLARRPCRHRWVVLGRVVRHKGLGDLFAAMREQRDPVPMLDVIGPIQPAERHWLRAASAGLATRVQIWGARSTEFVRDHLARAAWAVFPSRYEGFGLAALEAMGAGVPVVVADIPALREAVRPGGGRCIDFRDPRRAAERLDALRAIDNAEPLGVEARAVAWQADWDVRVTGFLEAYRKLLGTYV